MIINTNILHLEFSPGGSIHSVSRTASANPSVRGSPWSICGSSRPVPGAWRDPAARETVPVCKSPRRKSQPQQEAVTDRGLCSVSLHSMIRKVRCRDRIIGASSEIYLSVPFIWNHACIRWPEVASMHSRISPASTYHTGRVNELKHVELPEHGHAEGQHSGNTSHHWCRCLHQQWSTPETEARLKPLTRKTV